MNNNYEQRLLDSMEKIKTVEIKTIDDLFPLLTDQELETNSKRYRSNCFWRGLSDSKYSLQTALQRNCKDKSAILEGAILRNFAKYAVYQDPQINDSIWRQMMLGQHHGLPTRLLDWTYSPLVALHFAVNKSTPATIGETDCVVWKIDCMDLINSLSEKYSEELRKKNGFLFTVDMMQKCAQSLSEYDADMKESNSMVILEPPSIDQRIINQYSYFTVTPSHIDCLEEYMVQRMPNTVRYLIDKDLRWRIRDMLDLMNINERILMPGIDGLAAWLQRYYYVK